MENAMYRPTLDEIRATHRQGERATIQLFESPCTGLADPIGSAACHVRSAEQEPQKQQQSPSSDGFKKTPRTKSHEVTGQQKERRAGGAC